MNAKRRKGEKIMRDKIVKTVAFGYLGLQILFIVLKITDRIDWEWLIVLLPLEIIVAIICLCLVACMIFLIAILEL